MELVHSLGAIAPNRADVVTVQYRHAGSLAKTGRLAPRGATRLGLEPRRGEGDGDCRGAVLLSARAGAAFRQRIGRCCARRVGDDLVCLFVGGDWDRKGVAIAIAALADVPGKVKLWVVGRGDTERFRHLASTLGVADSVTFFGPRHDTERFYQGADVFVLPTEYETFSLAAYEAAASGLPVVAA